ncbi:MAG: hypothetical protein WA989_04340 [Henriciella sp.]|uniref:hypothetical protein n=1 Tax=Henriciella sp. TaxID=1968823 RepID=UPI003C77BC06
MSDWTVEQTSVGSGTIRHEAAPRFAARWTTGDDPDELAEIEGPCWTDEGSSPEDAIHLHGIAWSDALPEQADVQRLMAHAVREIDAAIARNL